MRIRPITDTQPRQGAQPGDPGEVDQRVGDARPEKDLGAQHRRGIRLIRRNGNDHERGEQHQVLEHVVVGALGAAGPASTRRQPFAVSNERQQADLQGGTAHRDQHLDDGQRDRPSQVHQFRFHGSPLGLSSGTLQQSGELPLPGGAAEFFAARDHRCAAGELVHLLADRVAARRPAARRRRPRTVKRHRGAMRAVVEEAALAVPDQGPLGWCRRHSRAGTGLSRPPPARRTDRSTRRGTSGAWRAGRRRPLGSLSAWRRQRLDHNHVHRFCHRTLTVA